MDALTQSLAMCHVDISERLIIVGVRVLIIFSSSYTVFVPLPAFALMVLPYTGCTETMRMIVLMAAEGTNCISKHDR